MSKMATKKRIKKRHLALIIFVIVFVLISLTILVNSCAPHLTAEDRQRDIEYLAHWAKVYGPCVELNEKYKSCPSYESLLPKYVKLARASKSNKDFFHIVYGYFKLISISGHSSMLSKNQLRGLALGYLVSKNPTGISPWQFGKAIYWTKLYENSFIHPPFHFTYLDGKYFTDEDWQYRGITIPKGSIIFAVNKMPSLSFLNHIEQDSWVRFVASEIDHPENLFLAINEGGDFKGWQVDFLLPDSTVSQIFVPAIKGKGNSASSRGDFSNSSKGNCVCLELNENTGYIRIKSFIKSFIQEDGNRIRDFLGRSHGKYKKLIIDIRNNPGGYNNYFYDNLIRPFLSHPVIYKQIVGIKKGWIKNIEQPRFEYLRGSCSLWAWEKKIEEVEPPKELDKKDWIFYEITRQIEPSTRYSFNGSLYVLINRGTNSAADNYVSAVNRIKMGLLVGQNTGGTAGAYFIPVFVRLPASGMIFLMEADLDLNPDGRFNEMFGSEPDIKLPKADTPASITKDDLLKDKWIKKIITEL